MKHEIEIPGFPDGYRLVRVDIKQNDRYRNDDGTSTIRSCEIVIEKIKPRRIVLEETDEDNTEYHNLDQTSYYADQYIGDICLSKQPKIWRVVDGNEATFRDRVREDLIKNKVIVKEGSGIDAEDLIDVINLKKKNIK